MIMNNNTFKEIKKAIKKAKAVAVFTHINPDYDALGSAMSMVLACRNMGKKSYLFTKDKLTDRQELIFDKSLVLNTKSDLESFDLYISVDTPRIERLGEYGQDFIKYENTIVIDHHNNNGLVGKLNYVNINYSSCSEIVLKILCKIKNTINSNVASYLFSGISGDTGTFTNTNVNENSFSSALQLLKLGADITSINEKQYKNRTKKDIDFERYLLNNFTTVKDCAYCLIDSDTLKQMKGKKSDCDNFSSELIKIQGINYSFSIIEDKKGIYHISLRSMNRYDVRKIAEKLGGGGHVCAAGATITAGDILEAKNKVLSLILK